MNKKTKDKQTGGLQSINHELIRQAVYDYLEENKGKKAPSYETISKMTGLSYHTVLRHFKELDFKSMITPMRALTPLVLNNIYNLSRKSPAAQKLWMQVVEGWSEKLDLAVQEDIKDITVRIIGNTSD